MRRVLSILILLVSHNAAAFCPPISSLCDDTVLLATRRNFVDVAAISSIAAFTSSFALSKKAVASGGATAGGVYLLSVRWTTSLNADWLTFNHPFFPHVWIRAWYANCHIEILNDFQAKQRYNNRVTKGVTAFVGLKGALENGDVDAVRPFFTSEDEGTWKDLSLAGYLLANAFRRNSTAAPDTLPSVKVSASRSA